MVTGRTGTAKYLRNRRRVLAEARAAGVTHCPGYVDKNGVKHPCGVELDYVIPLRPNSAEADHIVEYQYGGTDDVDNLRVLCRKQNLERSRKAPVPVDDFPTSRIW